MAKHPSLINEYRIFPRLIILWAIGVGSYVINWITTLPTPTAEQAAFASAFCLAIVGLAKYYIEGGNGSNTSKS